MDVLGADQIGTVPGQACVRAWKWLGNSRAGGSHTGSS